MKAFNFQEDVVSTEVSVTDGYADGAVGIVTGTSSDSYTHQKLPTKA